MEKKEFISLYKWENRKCYCALCGRELSDDMKHKPCTCDKARKAQAHNEQVRQELEALAQRACVEATKETFSLAEVLSVVSGCVVCHVDPIFTEDKVCEKISGTGSAKERVLSSVTPEQAEALCTAADELVDFLQEEHLAWETDITPKLKELADKYQLPLEFKF